MHPAVRNPLIIAFDSRKQLARLVSEAGLEGGEGLILALVDRRDTTEVIRRHPGESVAARDANDKGVGVGGGEDPTFGVDVAKGEDKGDRALPQVQTDRVVGAVHLSSQALGAQKGEIQVTPRMAGDLVSQRLELAQVRPDGL